MKPKALTDLEWMRQDFERRAAVIEKPRTIVVRLSWQRLPHRFAMQSLPSEVDANLVACDDGMWWITGRTTNALATPVSGQAADLHAAMDAAAEALPAWLEMADRDCRVPRRVGITYGTASEIRRRNLLVPEDL